MKAKVEMSSRIKNLRAGGRNLLPLMIHRSEADRICHELRKPLAAVRAFGEILRDELAGPLGPAQRDHLDVILRSTSRMDGYLVDLTAWADACASAPSLSTHDLELLCEQAQDAAAAAYRGQGVRLSLYTDGPQAHERVDAERFVEALGRMLDNALRVSPPGSEVLLRLGRNGAAARVEVVDQGPGLTPCEREQMFEPYFRGEHGGGLGVGLTIAHAWITKMGGSVRAEARTEGTAFVVDLPAEADAGAGAA